MEKFFLVLIAIVFSAQQVMGGGFDIKTSSVIDQPAVEVLGDYNNCWYMIGFEKPNHPDKPARFYILKYPAGFPVGKSSPVYPPFGEKTDYLKSAIIHGKICIFYARCQRVVERPDMVDARDGYKQIPQIMRQDYDPVTLLPAGDPVVVFDEAVEHFASSGIELAQSDDKTKTAILIRHYFRQQTFKVILIDNNTGPVFERSFNINTEKNELINFKRLVVGNGGHMLLEAQTQTDPLHFETKNKKGPRYYFYSLSARDDKPAMFSLAAAIGGNQLMGEPQVAILNSNELVISYDHLSNEHDPVLKGISVTKYSTDFTPVSTYDITPGEKLLARAAQYQKIKDKGFQYVQTRQILPLDGGTFMLIAEYQHNSTVKDNVTGVTSTTSNRNYVLAYRFDTRLDIKSADFIDKKQTTRKLGYAFSVWAFRKGNDVYLLHNEDCESDDEHGLYLMGTLLPATCAEPTTQKIVHTSEDFFTSIQHIYRGTNNRLLFTEEKVVDFDAEARELKFLEVTIK